MKVLKMFPLRKVAGEVGIEVEIEGNRLPGEVGRYWRVTGDGSLRGNGREYVLSRPINRSNVQEALETLHDTFRANDSKLSPSDRCGVHVHINCQPMEFDQTMAFITLYLALEDLLVAYCGEDREGNLFCLRAKDAEALLAALISCVRAQHFQPVQSDAYRYASINLTALSKYGSLEFRSMRTPEDVREIATWVELLLRVKDSALSFKNATAVIESMSMSGAERFLAEVMGPQAELIEAPGQDALLMNGIRRVQDLAYVKPMENLISQYQEISNEMREALGLEEIEEDAVDDPAEEVRMNIAARREREFMELMMLGAQVPRVNIVGAGGGGGRDAGGDDQAEPRPNRPRPRTARRTVRRRVRRT